MDVAELNIMSKDAIAMLIVFGLAPRIIALVVTVIHPILSQCFQESNDRPVLATVFIRETFDATSTNFIGSGAIAQQA